MFSNQTAEWSLSSSMPIPAMDAVRADRSSSRFLVGTSSVRASEDNHLHLLKYYADANQLASTATLSHPTGPVQQIVTCPTDKTILLTLAEDVSTTSSSSTTGNNHNADAAVTLWKIPLEVLEQNDGDLDYNDEDYDDGDDDANTNLPQDSMADTVTAMEQQAQLVINDEFTTNASSSFSTKIMHVAWRGGWDEDSTSPSSSTQGDVLTVQDDGSLMQWDVAFGAATATRHNQQAKTSTSIPWDTPPRLAWDPHHVDIAAVSTGTMVQLVDWRESSNSGGGGGGGILSCPHHRYGVTDLDYNPNKPHMLVTSGKDGLIKFWDLRKTSTQTSTSLYNTADEPEPSGSKRTLKKLRPLLVARGGHSHWATRVRYNPFHDQLVISAGTDSMVNLWRMSTISSAPLVMLEDENSNHSSSSDRMTMMTTTNTKHHNHTTTGGNNNATEKAASSTSSSAATANVRVSSFEHLDSVQSIAWGAADAWIYLSASYDGKVVLNHVPSQEKYKILL